MKHIVCYSGGHSSALVAIEVVRKYGKENVFLINHDIKATVEAEDIKRFKREVAEYLGLEITYVNHPEWDVKDQFDVVMDAKAFKVGNGTALCTNRLKTAPFHKWLDENATKGVDIIYYGFDAKEKVRIQRRVGILSGMGYKSEYPLAFWNRTIQSTNDIGIPPPNTYSDFKHANCTGCLKAGKQHWYIVYKTRKDIWEKAKLAEEVIGYSILKNVYLEELEEDFAKMSCMGIKTTEHEKGVTFFARVRKEFKNIEDDEDAKPCECVF
jgi:hypothetical protein